MGIHWSAIRQSPFADAVLEEFGPDGLGLPQLDILDNAEELVVSSPALLIVTYGNFPPAQLAKEARGAGLISAPYKGAAVWNSKDRNGWTLAQWSNQILLLGQRKTVEDALERARASQPQEEESRETTAAKAPQIRRYSPLLAKAARFHSTSDLWVVSSRLPDPLASRFVPFAVEVRGFEGEVSVEDGLQLEATFTASTHLGASALEDRIHNELAALPPELRNGDTTIDEDRVVLSLHATADQLSASLKNPAKPVEVAVAPPVLPAAPDLPQAPQAAPQVPAVMVERMPPPPPPQITGTPKGPRTIRIVGLDDGPVEIPYDHPPKTN